MSKNLKLLIIRPAGNEDQFDLDEECQFGNGYEEKEGHAFIKHERSILPSLKKYPFPDNIKNDADVIFNKMKPRSRRGKTYYMLLYYCIYCAFLEEMHRQRDMLKKGILVDVTGYLLTVDPIQLGKQFDLTRSEVQRCDAMFSFLQTGYKPPSNYISPIDYLPNYCKCECINLSDESIIDVLELANRILTKDYTLNRENSPIVAAGILYYYTIVNGIKIDNIDGLLSLVNKSFTTIENMYKRISIIDNS